MAKITRYLPISRYLLQFSLNITSGQGKSNNKKRSFKEETHG